MTAERTYSQEFGKGFATKMMEGVTQDNRNLYFALGKKVNGEIGSINRAANEFGAQKTAQAFDLNDLAALDPTGMASMVTSFTKYGSCTSNEFAVSTSELNFGNATSPQTQTFMIIAQRPTTITRLATPVMKGSTITTTADCVGKKMTASETCQVTVTAQSALNLDSEVRIYSDLYNTVPLAVHVLANSTVATADVSDPLVDETSNLTTVQGVWAYAYDQTKKIVIDSKGMMTNLGSAPLGNASMVKATGDAGKAYTFNTGVYGETMTLSGRICLRSTSRWRMTTTTSCGVRGTPVASRVR